MDIGSASKKDFEILKLDTGRRKSTLSPRKAPEGNVSGTGGLSGGKGIFGLIQEVKKDEE